DPWTLDDFYGSAKVTYDMVESVDHEVYLILDGRKITVAPPRLLSSLGYMEQMTHERVRFVVGTSNSTFLRGLVTLARLIVPGLSKKMYPVKSLEEAYQLIGEQDKAQQETAKNEDRDSSPS